MKTQKEIIFDVLVDVKISDDSHNRMIYHINSQFKKLQEIKYLNCLRYESGVIYGMLFTLEVVGVIAPETESMLFKILNERIAECEKRIES